MPASPCLPQSSPTNTKTREKWQVTTKNTITCRAHNIGKIFLALPFSSRSRHESRAARSHKAATGCGASVAIARLDRKSQAKLARESKLLMHVDWMRAVFLFVLKSVHLGSINWAQSSQSLCLVRVAEPEALQLRTRISSRRCTAEPAVAQTLSSGSSNQ